MIIIDTREQKPLWDPVYFNVVMKKLNEGDYTTDELFNKAHIERKSGIDLYGSIIQGHTRFRAEIQRSIDKNLKFAVFVECPEETFYLKRFRGGHRLQMPSAQLRKIIATMKEKYLLDFVWCEDRNDMMDKMCLWFVNAKSVIDGKQEIIFSSSEGMKRRRKKMVGFKKNNE